MSDEARALLQPAYTDDDVTVYAGDCLDVLATLLDASVDAVVCDPPYGLEFMGKEWDRFTDSRAYIRGVSERDAERGEEQDGLTARRRNAPESYVAGRPYQQWCEEWASECLRVLKPGGWLLAFGGARTYHRLAAGIEDAGFEIRDSIDWIFGSGFSKSWNFKTMYGGAWCECERGNALPYDHAGDTDVRCVPSQVHPPPVARGEGQDADVLASVQREAARGGVGEARSQGPRGVEPGDGSPGSRVDAGREEPRLAGRDLHRAGQGLSDGADAGPPALAGERLCGGTPARDGDTDRASGGAPRGGASHQRRPGGQSTGEPEAVRRPLEPLDDGALQHGPVCSRCGGLDPAYNGFGTALKPAHEPIVVARKPFGGTVAANVLAHGVGALNIDGCRVATDDKVVTFDRVEGERSREQYRTGTGVNRREVETAGRWPANIVLSHAEGCELLGHGEVRTATHFPAARPAGGIGNDGHSGQQGLTEMSPGAEVVERWACEPGCPVRELDAQSGAAGAAAPVKGTEPSDVTQTVYNDRQRVAGVFYGDAGGASRFFPVFRYEPKAGSAERPAADGVMHPTVKPVALMQWLVRLVAPRGAVVLDPFLGSGTTAEACVIEGMRCIGIEREPTYLPLIKARVSKPIPTTLGFDL